METNEDDGAMRWTVPIDADGVLTLPDEVWQLLGWKEGDTLEWIDQDDGSFLLVKQEDEETIDADQS
jgi:bifunctional DNA-binding transcriptional regulator/antitoxin component of YhaV-PrlF toxin-antitoxin module